MNENREPRLEAVHDYGSLIENCKQRSWRHDKKAMIIGLTPKNVSGCRGHQWQSDPLGMVLTTKPRKPVDSGSSKDKISKSKLTKWRRRKMKQ